MLIFIALWYPLELFLFTFFNVDNEGRLLAAYCFLAAWVVAMGISIFATDRLYKYGPYNANLVWQIRRNRADAITSAALGSALVAILFFVLPKYPTYVVTCIAFILGVVIARIILIFFCNLVASPYEKKKVEENARLRKKWAESEKSFHDTLERYIKSKDESSGQDQES